MLVFCIFFFPTYPAPLFRLCPCQIYLVHRKDVFCALNSAGAPSLSDLVDTISHLDAGYLSRGSMLFILSACVFFVHISLFDCACRLTVRLWCLILRIYMHLCIYAYMHVCLCVCLLCMYVWCVGRGTQMNFYNTCCSFKNRFFKLPATVSRTQHSVLFVVPVLSFFSSGTCVFHNLTANRLWLSGLKGK